MASLDQNPQINGTPPLRSFGFNVIGYVSSNLGLGLTARQFIRLLLNHGYPVAVFDIAIDAERARHDIEFDYLTVASPEDLPHSVNLIMLDIGILPHLFIDKPWSFLLPNRINIGLIWWELSVLPDQWVKALECFDILLAGSGFVRHTLETNISNVQILPCKHPLYGRASPEGNRERFGLPTTGFLFLTSFEPHSDPQRKNPFAAIRAFQAAFSAGDNTYLVIKLNNPKTTSAVGPAKLIEQMHALCGNDTRIIVIAESLPYSDVLSLYRSCDALVSLHRAEGLGLAPLECMSLGKPVIATAWSGNMSYMNYSNACLVRYQLVPVDGSVRVYKSSFLGKQAFWADPNIEDATRWMRLLFSHPELCAAIGKQAQKDFAKYEHEAEKADFLNEIESIWNAGIMLNKASLNYPAKLAMLLDAEYAAKWPALKYRIWKLRNWLDRHVTWRLRS